METIHCPIPNPRGRGFTLVELLVVIAIIAILAALLFPVLDRSKATALGTQCSNDHQQLVTAWILYCHDNNDQLPVVDDWVAGDMSDPFDATNTALLLDPQQSALAQYIKVPGIYKCPGDFSHLARSTSMNNRLNPILPGFWLHGGGAAYQIFSQLQQIRMPSDIYVTTDERSDTINDASLCEDLSNTGNPDGTGTSSPYWLVDYPADYHNRAGRFSFVDGHVEGHKWVGPYLLMSLGQAKDPVFTSPTDADTRWIQNHCSYLK